MKRAILTGLLVAAACAQVRFADAQEQGPAPQVLVRVKMIEASRTRLDRLGVDLAEIQEGQIRRAASDQRLAGLILTDRKPGAAGEQQKPTPPAAARTVARFDVFNNVDKFLSMLPVLEKDGLARVLAAPTLVTVSGHPASLQVGAEVPAGGQAEGKSTESEGNFAGTRLDLVPTVLEGGRIRLEFRLRVTEVDPAHANVAAGDRKPTMRTWGVSTAVEMRSGQTAVLGGLVQKRHVTQTATGAVSAGPKRDASGSPPDTGDAKPEEVECLVLISPEIVDPGPRVVGRAPDSRPR